MTPRPRKLRLPLHLPVGCSLLLGAAAAACGGAGEGREPAGETPVASPPVAPGKGDRFVDVTAQAGLDFVHRLQDGHMSNIVESLGGGAAWLDYDGDGRLDLYLVQSGWAPGVVEGEARRPGPTGRLYRSEGEGRFRDVTRQAGLEASAFGIAAVAADYDGDGWTDLYLCDLGPNRLYRNRGDGRFEEIAARAGVDDPRLSVGATFLDYDGDGVLDLYVTNYLEFDPKYAFFYSPDVFPPPLAYAAQPDALYRGLGDGRFEDVSEVAGIAAKKERGMSVVAADFDADGRTDVFVSNDAGPNFLWHNQGDGTLREDALRCGLAYGMKGDATAAMTADLGDVDLDGLADLVVTDMSYGSLYVAVRPGVFTDKVFSSGVAAISGQYVSWGGGYIDYDDDGDLDLFIVNGDLHHMVGWEDLLLANDGTGHFSDAAQEGGAYFSAKLLGRGGVAVDYDDDGDQDLLVTNLHDRPVLLRNEGGARGAWISVRLVDDTRNVAAYGAQVALVHAGRTQRAEMRCPTVYLSSGDPRLHFGLGTCERIERIEVVWPDGELQVLEDVQPRQHLVIRRSRP